MSGKNDDTTKVLVCQPAELEGMVAQGSVYDRECATCGRRVVVAPSGQKALAQSPSMTLLCGFCFLNLACKMSDEERGSMKVGLPDTVENMRKETQNLQPNFWRKRN